MENYENIKIIDLHTHTRNSPDGNHTALSMAESAEEKGFRCLAFTDHCEVDYFYKDNYDKVVENSYKEVCETRAAMAGRLEVLRGIELAQPHYVPELARQILDAHQYDVVIGSIHNLRGQEDFYYMKSFDGIVIEDMINQYFDELLLMLQWGDFDILAHITYPFRYIYNICGYIEDIDKYSKKVDELLKLCAEKDKALEINMGGLKYPINKPSPDIDTIKRYRELGGKLISVGSDSHYAERVGFGIPRAFEMAREAGFKSVVRFEERKLFEHAIV